MRFCVFVRTKDGALLQSLADESLTKVERGVHI